MGKSSTSTTNGHTNGNALSHSSMRSISSSVLQQIEVKRSDTVPRLAEADRRVLNRVTALVGCWQLVLTALTTAATFAVWPLVATLEGRATVAVHWFGPDFRLTALSGVLILGVIGGVGGSLVHTITIFSSRVGRDTLEASFLWWYLLRPFAAALLALLFVAAVQSGLVAVGGKPEGLVLAFVAGGLAGLFTDAVLQKLRGLLGATSTQKTASSQDVPLAAPPRHNDSSPTG
jgi:hypothetical protein